MTLSCERVFTLLSEYLDGELPSDIQAAFDKHIGGCTRCARFGQEFAQVVQSLRASERPVMPDALRTRLRELARSSPAKAQTDS